MAGYKEPGFQDRTAAAAKARAKALEQLQAKPPADPAVLAERAAKAREREAAQTEKRAAMQREREAKIAARIAKAAELEAEAARLKEEAESRLPPPELTEAERKEARDARYAARKARKK
ncbi:MAG: DUF6481 family protein [Novosphingobium sp.]